MVRIAHNTLTRKHGENRKTVEGSLASVLADAGLRLKSQIMLNTRFYTSFFLASCQFSFFSKPSIWEKVAQRPTPILVAINSILKTRQSKMLPDANSQATLSTQTHQQAAPVYCLLVVSMTTCQKARAGEWRRGTPSLAGSRSHWVWEGQFLPLPHSCTHCQHCHEHALLQNLK